MEYKKWKTVLQKNYHQLFFVVLAFLLMIAVSIVSVSQITIKKLISASEEALYTVEANIKTNLREPEATLVSSIFSIRDMIVNQRVSQEEILAYLVGLSEWLLENEDRVSGFNGIYGVVRGEYLDGTGWIPPDDYVPQERPWYQLAVQSNGEIAITPPYIDAQTHVGIISLAQELFDADGSSLGIISVDVMLTRLTEYVTALQHGYGGYGILLDNSLNVIAHPIGTYSGQPLASLSDDYQEVAVQLQAHIDISAKTIHDIDGRKMILFVRELYNGWYVGILTPADSYYSEMHRLEATLILMGLVLMLVLSYLLLRLSAAKMRSDAENQQKSTFLARMSHEIRTPMNAILGMVELMLRKDLPAAAREEALAVKLAGTNLLSIINDILDFSKIESGRMELVLAEYPLSSLLTDVINIIQMRVSETNLTFTTEIDKNLPAVLVGDQVRLRQILLNLLSNGVKYTREGGVSFTATGEKTEDGILMLTFTIADTGIGIKEEDLDRLFGDFTQLDTHKNSGIEGTGLGLAIAHSLSQLMGGTISVSSRYGKGSVFTLCLPQKIAVDTPIRMGSMDIDAATETKDGGFTVPSARVLLVDDVEVNLMVAEGLLSIYEPQIDCCTGGKEAIELIKQHQYDIVFMDHMMPEMDGIEAVKIIRNMKSRRFTQVPIIALTANAISGMREIFLDAGFSDYLAKPIEMNKLDEMMERWIPPEKRVWGGEK